MLCASVTSLLSPVIMYPCTPDLGYKVQSYRFTGYRFVGHNTHRTGVKGCRGTRFRGTRVQRDQGAAHSIMEGSGAGCTKGIGSG